MHKRPSIQMRAEQPPQPPHAPPLDTKTQQLLADGPAHGRDGTGRRTGTDDSSSNKAWERFAAAQAARRDQEIADAAAFEKVQIAYELQGLQVIYQSGACELNMACVHSCMASNLAG